jgi:hypothetical protein
MKLVKAQSKSYMRTASHFANQPFSSHFCEVIKSNKNVRSLKVPTYILWTYHLNVIGNVQTQLS